MRISIPISGPTKEDRAIQANSQRSINMYPSIKDQSAKSQVVMYSHPGRTRTAIAGLGPGRSNGYRWKGNLYWVSGAELYKQDTTDIVTKVTNNLLTSGGRVVFAGGRDYLMLTDGSYGYYTDGTTLTQITDVDFPANTSHCSYLDGYFVVNDSQTDDFYINETQEDPSAWASLDFGTAAARPDRGLATATHAKDLYILGEETVQPYTNSGNADFPFDPYPNAIPVGIDAPYSVVDTPYGLFFLGVYEGGVAVVKIQGNGFSVISDEDIGWQINQFSSTMDAVAWTRFQGALLFYEIIFPTVGRGFSYCVNHEFWSELSRSDTERFRGIGYGSLNKRSFISDYEDGKIYELDFNVFTDDGEIMRRVRRTRVVHQEGKPLVFRRLILDADAGVGLIDGQGSNPMVMMRYSVNGGKLWSSELWRSLGEIGKPETKPNWNNLGQGTDWVFEFACTDPVPFSLFNLFADVEVGR